MKRREDRVTEGLPVLVSAEPTNDFRNLAKQICSMKMLGARLASHVPVLDLEFLMGEYTLIRVLQWSEYPVYYQPRRMQSIQRRLLTSKRTWRPAPRLQAVVYNA